MRSFPDAQANDPLGLVQTNKPDAQGQLTPQSLV